VVPLMRQSPDPAQQADFHQLGRAKNSEHAERKPRR
jgi:hypothetical protein